MSCSRRPRILGVALLAAALALQACGPLPRPFKDKSSNDLAHPRDGVGVVVAPIDGGSPEFRNDLPDAVVEALHSINVPASVSGDLDHAYLLEGKAFLHQGRVKVFWLLTNEKGSLVARRMIEIDADRRAWEDAKPRLLREIAGQTAFEIASRLKPMDAFTVLPERPLRIGLTGVTGAPGDGNVTLARAYRAVFKQVQVPMVDDPAYADVLLAVTVKVEELNNRVDSVELLWELSAPYGEVYGTIRQQNNVPRGFLRGRWGRAAYDVVWSVVEEVAISLEDIQYLKAERANGPPGTG